MKFHNFNVARKYDFYMITLIKQMLIAREEILGFFFHFCWFWNGLDALRLDLIDGVDLVEPKSDKRKFQFF